MICLCKNIDLVFVVLIAALFAVGFRCLHLA
jgi:hypothetical protein